MMAVSATYKSELTVTDTISGTPALSTSDNTVTHNALNRNLTLNATSTPDAELVAEFRATLSGGAFTIDLTAIPTLLGTVDASGKKVRAFKFRALSTNSGAITVAPGASHAYNMLGTGWSIPVPVDGEVLMYLKDTAPAVVDSSADTLSLSGTGTDALDVIFLFG